MPAGFPGLATLDPAVDAHGAVPPPVNELALAQQAFRNRDFGLAEQRFRAIVDKDPRNANAWLGLGSTHDELARFDLADQDYAQVARLTGPSVALLNDRGYSYYMRGDYAKARALYAQARALDPGNIYVLRNIQKIEQGSVGPASGAAKS
jgi:Flp pilus assembly protein TadD